MLVYVCLWGGGGGGASPREGPLKAAVDCIISFFEMENGESCHRFHFLLRPILELQPENTGTERCRAVGEENSTL